MLSVCVLCPLGEPVALVPLVNWGIMLIAEDEDFEKSLGQFIHDVLFSTACSPRNSRQNLCYVYHCDGSVRLFAFIN